MRSTACSYTTVRAPGGYACACTQAQAARRTCSTVKYRLWGAFFLSELLMQAGAEQLADLGEVQVPVDPPPTAHLKMVHPQLALGDLETPFDRPPRERHPQQPFERDGLAVDHPVGQEVLDLLGIEHVAGDDQRMGRTRQTVGTMTPVKRRMLDLPDDRPFLPIFDPEPLPFLPAKDRRIGDQIAHLTGRKGLAHQAGVAAFTAACMPFLGAGMPQDPKLLQPAGEVTRQLADEVLAQPTQAVQELPTPAIQFIERPRTHPNPMTDRTRDLRQSDLGLGPQDHVLRNPDFLTPNRVFGPLFREEQIAVQKTLEIARHIAQMNSHHTVVRLARVAAPLPLDPGGVPACCLGATVVDG